MPAALASAGPAKRDLPALHHQPAAARRLRAGDDLDQRRLAGAVVAEQCQHLAGMDVEADILAAP